MLAALVATKLGYEAWRLVHKLMAVAYGFGLVHYYSSSTYGPWGTGAFSVWLDAVNLIGVAAAMFAILLYAHFGFAYRYRITGLRPVGQGNLEITAHLAGRPVGWRAGQFAFIRFPGHRFWPHPFTIASAPDGGTIQFAIRALGDDTARLPGVLKVGDPVQISGAHGRFDFRKGSARQVWIAAGIGVTPFRAFWQAGVPGEFDVDFFYSFKAGEGAYLDEINELVNTSTNVRVHLIDTAKEGRLTGEKIAKTLAGNGLVDVYFCGPKPMREAISHGLREAALNTRFHREEFTFGR